VVRGRDGSCCAAHLRPFPAGAFVASVADVAETVSIDQIDVRIGHSANISCSNTAPDGQRHDMPKTGLVRHHVAFATDIGPAVEYMVEGVRKIWRTVR
jgi:hypothetical protein